MERRLEADRTAPLLDKQANSTFINNARPKYEQGAIMFEGESVASVSHAHTTISSEHEASNNDSLDSYVSTRDIRQFIRELHGRTWNNLNEVYFLPADQSEWTRLDKQHSALLIGFGGLYPCPEVVEALLAPRNNEAIRILDVGCGTGSWIMEMAHQFPHASFVGIDLAPVPVEASALPTNVSFEIDDINNGLSHYWGQFSLVHMRCVMTGITDMTKTLEDLEKCLKPGGILIVIEGDVQLTEDRKSYIKMARLDGDEDVSGVSENGCWFRRMVWEAGQACLLAGAGVSTAPEILDYGPWDHELCDPETTVAGSLYLPMGPWAEGSNAAETQMLRYVGMLIRQDFLNIHRAWHSILLRHGVTQAALSSWSNHVDEELNLMKHKMWVRFRFFFTRRREGKNLPAPPLPISDSDPSPRNVKHMYPAIEMYHSKEETRKKTEERMATFGTPPTSAVQRVLLGV